LEWGNRGVPERSGRSGEIGAERRNRGGAAKSGRSGDEDSDRKNNVEVERS
jgi:hypothetical protein